MPKLVGINEKGRRVGQDHPKAKLLDSEVDLMFELYEDGMRITELARRFEVRKSTVNDILKGRRRAQHATRWKRVESTHDEDE